MLIQSIILVHCTVRTFTGLGASLLCDRVLSMPGSKLDRTTCERS